MSTISKTMLDAAARAMGIEVRYVSHLKTPQAYMVRPTDPALALLMGRREVFVCHSPLALSYHLRAVRWHDDELNCATWNGQCNCDRAEDA